MGKVTDKRFQMIPFFNRLFPPSSPEITSPGRILHDILPVFPALPPSLFLERTDIVTISTVNPATLVVFPANGVPTGRFMWVHGATWEQRTAISAAQGMAFISVRKTNEIGGEVHMAQGHFSQTGFLPPLSTHSAQQGSTIAGAALGGGIGGFIVPQGMQVHASTSATPAATTIYVLKLMFTEGDIGELFPPIS